MRGWRGWPAMGGPPDAAGRQPTTPEASLENWPDGRALAGDRRSRSRRVTATDPDGRAGRPLRSGMADPVLPRGAVARPVDHSHRGAGPRPRVLRRRAPAGAQRRWPADEEPAVQERERTNMELPLRGQGPDRKSTRLNSS